MLSLLVLGLVTVGGEKAPPLSVTLRLERSVAVVTLCNQSKAHLLIWDPLNTEGSEMFSFRLKVGAKAIVRSMPVVVRSAGFATVWRLAPNESRDVRVNLDSLVGDDPWPNGPGSVVAVVESKRSASPPITGAWVGRVESRPVRLVWGKKA